MGDQLLPHRVEWRTNLNARWARIKDCAVARDAAGSAEDVASQSRDKWGGYTRIISQHVIEDGTS